MRGPAAAISVWLALVAGAVAQAERVLPATEADFAQFLQGCWSAEAHATLVDSEIHNVTIVCFEDDLIVAALHVDEDGKESSFEYTGTYDFADDRIYLTNARGSEAWSFGPDQFNCDAVVRPDRSLQLSSCLESQTGVETYDLYFERVVEEPTL